VKVTVTQQAVPQATCWTESVRAKVNANNTPFTVNKTLWIIR